MTNAIEQTKRAMYFELTLIRRAVKCSHTFRASEIDQFENKLEAHLEELRKGMVACNESTVKCAKASHESFKALESANYELAERCIALTNERDSMRNKLQALQMASSTAAEVIRGLRSELEEAREGASKPLSQDIYMMGFNGIGTPCPYPINTIERLHWMDGARERMEMLNQSCGVQK